MTLACATQYRHSLAPSGASTRRCQAGRRLRAQYGLSVRLAVRRWDCVPLRRASRPTRGIRLGGARLRVTAPSTSTHATNSRLRVRQRSWGARCRVHSGRAHSETGLRVSRAPALSSALPATVPKRGPCDAGQRPAMSAESPRLRRLQPPRLLASPFECAQLPPGTSRERRLRWPKCLQS